MKISDFTQIPLGTIVPFALDDDSIPDGWLKCDGSAIPAKHATLRGLLKKEYTPNLAGRTLIGSGTAVNSIQSDGKSPNFDGPTKWTLNNTGGEYKHQLTVAEIPNHNHTINNGDFGLHRRSFDGNSDSDLPYKTKLEPAKGDRVLSGTDYNGGNGFHNTMQPYYVINYIIYAGSE